MGGYEARLYHKFGKVFPRERLLSTDHIELSTELEPLGTLSGADSSGWLCLLFIAEQVYGQFSSLL